MFFSDIGVPFKVNVGSKYQENPIRDEFIILKNACFFKYMTNSFLPGSFLPFRYQRDITYIPLFLVLELLVSSALVITLPQCTLLL